MWEGSIFNCSTLSLTFNLESWSAFYEMFNRNIQTNCIEFQSTVTFKLLEFMGTFSIYLVICLCFDHFEKKLREVDSRSGPGSFAHVCRAWISCSRRSIQKPGELNVGHTLKFMRSWRIFNSYHISLALFACILWGWNGNADSTNYHDLFPLFFFFILLNKFLGIKVPGYVSGKGTMAWNVWALVYFCEK